MIPEMANSYKNPKRKSDDISPFTESQKKAIKYALKEAPGYKMPVKVYWVNKYSAKCDGFYLALGSTQVSVRLRNLRANTPAQMPLKLMCDVVFVDGIGGVIRDF